MQLHLKLKAERELKVLQRVSPSELIQYIILVSKPLRTVLIRGSGGRRDGNRGKSGRFRKNFGFYLGKTWKLFSTSRGFPSNLVCPFSSQIISPFSLYLFRRFPVFYQYSSRELSERIRAFTRRDSDFFRLFP